MKDYLKKNKKECIILLITFLVLVYSSLNTFIINDDIPYSFFLRKTSRITNIFQIIHNQYYDYNNINPRVIIHSIVQFLLIFDKKLWSILNPVVLILTFIMINKLIELFTKKKVNNYIYIIPLFLMLISYKQIIYWVAGSVNYMWPCLFLLILLYNYIKNDKIKESKWSYLVILLFSILHESTFVFSFIFLIGNMLYDYMKNKKFNIKLLTYFIPVIISGLFLLLAPSIGYRMSDNITWNNLSFIDKIILALPITSSNLYNITNIYNIIPLIYIILLVIRLYKEETKLSYFGNFLILLNIGFIIISKNSWLYLILTILIALYEFYLNHRCKRTILNVISLALYAVSFSVIITPEYTSFRQNYYIYIYMIFYIVLMINEFKINKSKIFNVLSYIVLIFLLTLEVYAYTSIGNTVRSREKQIDNYRKQNKSNLLCLDRADTRFSIYHLDIDEPSSKEYFTYRLFLQYYNLDKNTNFKIIDKGEVCK